MKEATCEVCGCYLTYSTIAYQIECPRCLKVIIVEPEPFAEEIPEDTSEETPIDKGEEHGTEL